MENLTFNQADANRESPQDYSSEAITLAQRYEGFIKGKVANFYHIAPSSLSLSIQESFIDPSQPNKCLFYIYDSDGNCYGIACDLDQNRNPINYRCGKLDKFS